jgi:DNA-binding CsgD family transcriptional regulator/tetratricopeptide (TPR) repeat protein
MIEDIHWADRSTIDVLTFLARHLREAPVLLVITCRTDEPQVRRDVLPLIAELGRLERVERIELPRLNRAEVMEQLSAIIGGPASSALTDAVYARSEGNAFFSEELLAAEAIADSLPPTLRDVLAARLAAMSPDAQRLARAASAAGRRFTESMLASITGAPDEAFQAALREAIAHQIIVRQDGRDDELVFRHALMQEILHDDLLPSERRQLHAACAIAMEQGGGLSPDAIRASELAYHWQAAGKPERALPPSIAAGLAAESSGAMNEAATQFERALAILDEAPELAADLPMDRIGLLERAAANVPDPARAVRHVREALQLIQRDEEPQRAGTLYAWLGRHLWATGDSIGAVAAGHEAVRLVPAEPPSVARARVTAAVGQILMVHSGAGIEYCEEAVRIAAHLGEREIEGYALNTLGMLTAYGGDVDQGLQMLRRSLDIARETRSVFDLGRAYANLTDVLIFAAGRYDEAGDLGEEAIGQPEAPNFTGVLGAIIHADITVARYLAGRWEEAAAALTRAHLQLATGVGEVALDIRAAQLAVGRGAFAELQLATLGDRAAASDDLQWIAPLAAARAELAIWQDDPSNALQVIDAALAQVRRTADSDISRLGPLLALGVRAAADAAERGRRHRDAGDSALARTQAEPHLAAMRHHHADIGARRPEHIRLAQPFLALCEAEATRADGRSDAAAWGRVAAEFTDLPQPYTRAYARYREGEALLAAHRAAGRAASALREAHEAAIAMGATPLQHAVEAVAARGRVELLPSASVKRQPPKPFTLTAREQQVLGLLASGMTNRQIAERLFITERTAGHHVSNVFAKLGVHRRAEAAAEAVRLGIAVSST